MIDVNKYIFSNVLEKFADKQFFMSESRNFSFLEFFEEAILFSDTLSITPKKNIAICSNNPEFLIKAMFALWIKGAVVVPLNPKNVL